MRYNSSNIDPRFLTKILHKYIDIIRLLYDEGKFSAEFISGKINYSSHNGTSPDIVIDNLLRASIIKKTDSERFSIHNDIYPFLSKLFDVYKKSSKEDFNSVLGKVSSYSKELISFLESDSCDYKDFLFCISNIYDVTCEIDSLISSDVVVLNNTINSINRMEFYHHRLDGVRRLQKSFIEPSEFLFKTDGIKPEFLNIIESIKHSLSVLLKKHHVFSCISLVDKDDFSEKIIGVLDAIEYVLAKSFDTLDSQRRKIDDINDVYGKDHKLKKGISIFLEYLTDSEKCSKEESDIIHRMCSDKEDQFKKPTNNTYSYDVYSTLKEYLENSNKEPLEPLGVEDDGKDKFKHHRSISILDIFNDMIVFFDKNNISKINNVHQFIVDEYYDEYDDNALREIISGIYFSNDFFEKEDCHDANNDRMQITLHNHILSYCRFSVSINKNNKHYKSHKTKKEVDHGII